MVDVEVDLAVRDGVCVGIAALVGDGAAPALQVVLGHAEVLEQQVSALSIHGALCGAADAQGQLLLEDLLDGGDIVLLQECVGHAVDVADSSQAADDRCIAAGSRLAQSAFLHCPLCRSTVDEGQIGVAGSKQIRSTHTARRVRVDVDSLETASLLQHLGHCNDHIVRARTDLIGAEVQSLFAHIGQTVHSLCLNGRSCLTGSCSAGGGRAAAGCQSTSRCHSTRNLQKAATRNLFHNLVLLFSWGSRVANRTVYFMPSSAASPLFTVFVRFCCLNYIQNGRPLQRLNRLVSVLF